MLADGETYDGIQEAVGCGRAYIGRWRGRFLEQGVAGMYARHKGRRPTAMTPRREARILARTQRKPKDGSTHWSTRKLAKELGVGHMLVQRVWSRAGIKPHRIKHYMASNDPAFESKAADVIGLYLNPPRHTAVFSLDEKTQVQALDRPDPVLPLPPGRLERHGFESARDFVPVRGAQHAHGQGARSARGAAQQRGLRGLPGEPARQRAAQARGPRHPGQPLGPQEPPCAAISRRSPEAPLPLHADLLVLAESG